MVSHDNPSHSDQTSFSLKALQLVYSKGATVKWPSSHPVRREIDAAFLALSEGFGQLLCIRESQFNVVMVHQHTVGGREGQHKLVIRHIYVNVEQVHQFRPISLYTHFNCSFIA